MFLNENINPTLLRENEAFGRDFMNNDNKNVEVFRHELFSNH